MSAGVSPAATPSRAPAESRASPAELLKTWLLAGLLLCLLFGMRLFLQEPPHALFDLMVPVSVRGAPHDDAEELAHHFLYTEPFDLHAGNRIALSLTRGPADGILAVTVDLVPEQGPSMHGVELFAAERMSIQGRSGQPRVSTSLRGAEAGHYRLRVAGTWIGQPGESRQPEATLAVKTVVGSSTAFWWAALLLIVPALFATLRSLWRRQAAKAAPTSGGPVDGSPADHSPPDNSDEAPFVSAVSDTISALTPEGSLSCTSTGPASYSP